LEEKSSNFFLFQFKETTNLNFDIQL